MDEIHLIKNTQKRDLESYNDIVVSCQDEAYTLAFSILRDVELACKVVQEAFRQVYYTYTRGGDSHKIVSSVLQEVLFACRQVNASGSREAGNEIPGWAQLECYEQETLLLVDMLGKTYHETAFILKCSEYDVARLIACGRCKLATGFCSQPE
jgi:DNA-directed RNA polymerase specialized sigma24 family protein